MPWKQGYTISDERSLTDSELRWPDGARCCVAMTVDLSVASGPEGVTAADLTTPEALFGANQGLAALREVLRRHAMRATFAEITGATVPDLNQAGSIMIGGAVS